MSVATWLTVSLCASLLAPLVAAYLIGHLVAKPIAVKRALRCLAFAQLPLLFMAAPWRTAWLLSAVWSWWLGVVALRDGLGRSWTFGVLASSAPLWLASLMLLAVYKLMIGP